MKSKMRVWLWGVCGFLCVAAFAEPMRPLPQEFQWCVSTAAHCIEGGNDNNDFWDWENTPPVCNEKGCSCTTQGCVKSGVALDHWNRLDEDSQLISELGVNQYRMSIEWSRIEPQEGRFDDTAIAKYRFEFEALARRGVTPFVTLQHFTLPRWLRKKGGWMYERAPEVFARFAERAYREFGDLVPMWVTINEPFVHLGGGYVMGLTPPSLPTPKMFSAKNGSSNDYLGGHTPGAEDFKRMIEPSKALLRSHAEAYRAIHREAQKAGRPVKVGLAHHMRVFEGARPYNLGDYVLAGVLDQVWNWTFSDAVMTGNLKISIPFVFSHSEKIDGIAGTQDFFGLNYYTRDMVKLQWGKGMAPMLDLFFKKGRPTSMLGWDLYPEGLELMLRAIHKRLPTLPIYITENGIATLSDTQRQTYIHDHVQAVQRAFSSGVDVKGYCHYTWADDFELSDGYDPKFGLYHVDFKTLNRTLKPSGRYFRETIRNRGAIPLEAMQ